MIDVYVRTFIPKDISHSSSMRLGMAIACIHRWQMQKDANLTIMDANKFPFSHATFHMESKKFAEEHSTTSVYVVADDDCLILGADFIERGVDGLLSDSKWGIVTATSICDGLYPAGVDMPEEAVEAHAVGGVSFVRKGILKKFPPCDVDKVDEAICKEIVRAGYKCGVMPHLKFNHLGMGYSLSTKGCWAA